MPCWVELKNLKIKDYQYKIIIIMITETKQNKYVFKNKVNMIIIYNRYDNFHKSHLKNMK